MNDYAWQQSKRLHDKQKRGKSKMSEWETGISSIGGMRVVGKECFEVHFFKNNSECHQRSQSKREDRKRHNAKKSFALRFRFRSYITSQSTHFLNMPHHGSIIRGSSMEGRRSLHLQSAARWQGDSNENDTGQKWTVKRWNMHKMNNMKMNTWICDWYE